MLRVGVDAWNLPGDRRGVGRYVREVLRAWAQVFSHRVAPVLIVPEFPAFVARRRYLGELDGARFAVVSRAMHRFAGLDVLWFPFNGCSWTSFALPAVATLHDATPFVFPEHNGDAQPIMRTAAQRCRALLTDSEFSRAELSRALGIAPERLTAVPLGVAAVDAPDVAPAQGAQPYVLFVGTTDRRKGLDVLIDAMRRVQAVQPSLELRLAGAASDALPAHDGVRMRVEGFVDDARLEALYRGASLFVFPSRYEGFGLPPLEAMRFGTPVVAAASSCIPEVLGDAAVFAPPDDAQAFANAVLRVFGDDALRAQLRERGLARARALSWTACAGTTLHVLEAAAR